MSSAQRREVAVCGLILQRKVALGMYSVDKVVGSVIADGGGKWKGREWEAVFLVRMELVHRALLCSLWAEVRSFWLPVIARLSGAWAM